MSGKYYSQLSTYIVKKKILFFILIGKLNY